MWDFFDNLVKDSSRIMQREPERMQSVIAHSCRMKAAIVERDEYDTGERAMLNFGHTVGHAIEAAGHFPTIYARRSCSDGGCLQRRDLASCDQG